MGRIKSWKNIFENAIRGAIENVKKYFYIGMAIILILSVMLVAYGGYLNYNDSNQIANRMEERALQLTGAKVESRFLNPAVEVDTLKLYSDNMTDAVALTEGRITQIMVAKNNYVHKGDVIMTLINDQIPLKVQQADSNIQRAESTYSQSLSNIQRAEAALTNATNVYNRQQRLMARNATSQEKLEAAAAEYTAAQEAVRAAQAESESARVAIEIANSERQQYIIQESRQNVVAPIDGNVLLIYKREGAYVQGGTPLVLIGDFEKLFFSTTFENINANSLKVGDSVTLEFNERGLQKAYDTEYASGNLGKSEKIMATIKEITPPMNESATIRRVLWEIDNRARILEPMTYNNIKIQTNSGHRCLTVPLSAMADSENNLVFVVNGENKIEKREVKCGANDGKYIEILSGLKENEVVVVESFEGLEDGLKVEINFEEGAVNG